MLENFKDAKVLVIGDVMLDVYLYGDVERISPEAPVPVVHVKKESYVPGGAANVANNVSTLKAKSTLVGITGNDENSTKLKRLLENQGITYRFVTTKHPTITKTRVVSSNQQILRIDVENPLAVEKDIEKEISGLITENIKKADVVVISDYGKGVCTSSICQHIVTEGSKNNKPVIIDPKKKDWEKYRGASILTPNLKELSDFLGKPVANEDKEIEAALKEAYKKLGVENIIVTRSEKGMSLFDGKDLFHIPTEAKEVYDVSGAGDTVIATLSVALASKMDIKEAAIVANKAAGIVVGKAGTAPIYYEELLKFLEKQSLYKLINLEEMLIILEDLRKKGKRIVFTNGCFDIIHRGHVTYLAEAKKLGDILIIGLNSDNSVRRIKGEGRPVNSEKDRAIVLSALEMVDYIVIFNEDTPYELLSKIKPDILVKGGDYRVEDVIGREFAGKTVILPYIEGYSTTKIISGGKK
ncbi:MAG: bifunctional D-glycero-beta-D-manno-heptose-7-phosphate kinase/D-glycero-beta-D-manno-heptose 1-phosphate adenylyltransferase HldE [Brevinematia bacterium]